jgi:apolipoprotein N-acyltransferase
MVQAGSLLWLARGVTLFGVITRLTIPPLTWAAIALLLHASRSMPVATGLPCLWVGLFAALSISERGVLPISGPAYFVVIARGITTTVALPFAVDRLVASRLGGVGMTLVFPMAFVAAEFLRSRLSPAAT